MLNYFGMCVIAFAILAHSGSVFFHSANKKEYRICTNAEFSEYKACLAWAEHQLSLGASEKELKDSVDGTEEEEETEATGAWLVERSLVEHASYHDNRCRNLNSLANRRAKKLVGVPCVCLGAPRDASTSLLGCESLA